jgi:hypothetical protein
MPKGATLSHHGIINASVLLSNYSGLIESERVTLIPIPTFHTVNCFLIRKNQKQNKKKSKENKKFYFYEFFFS